MSTHSRVSPPRASAGAASAIAPSMSSSFVPVHEYEKKSEAEPTMPDVSTPAASPSSSSVSASESPLPRVRATTLAAKPSSLHTSPMTFASPPCRA